ncbi:MAG: BTAD domain-containing putative transcriptional regulator [Egibacteraceae bacterium]
MALEFRVLGPVEVVCDGRLLDLGPPRQRALLAMLVVHANTVVSVDRLLDELWAGEPPASAPHALHVYVSNLRKALEPCRWPVDGGHVLVTRRPGYLLRAAPERLDAAGFERLVASGRQALEAGDPDLAEARLRAALAMWYGQALADFADLPFARGEIARLEELRLVATETMIAADLGLGRHAGLVGELEALVVAHPLREGLRGQLMLALYRAGRQAGALDVYHDVRALLADTLGIDPSAELQRLHEAILVQKSELDWVPPDPGRASRPARAPTAGRMPASGPSPFRGVFVGRDVEVARLWGALADARSGRGRLVLVGGEPGIGKTSIARNLADQAQAAGMAVLWGRVWEADGAPPFWPWVQILRSWMQACEQGRLGDALGSDAAVIAQLVPRVAERLPGLADPPDLPAAQARFRLFDAVTGVLKRVAGARPLVVVLDDLHRADVPSLRLLQFLVRELADARLLVVGTFRDAKADLDEVVVGVLADLGREPVTCRMRLEGLSGKHVGHFVERVTGLDVSSALVAKLWERTGGNPLFEPARAAAGGAG